MRSPLFNRKLVFCLIVVLLTFFGCEPENFTNDTTNVVITIIELTASAGDADDDSNFLFSDVCDPPVCTTFNDNATVTMTATPKDVLRGASPANSVTFTSYRVTYTRTDGRNAPGIDVPFPFSAPLQLFVPINGEGATAFVVVRNQAKRDDPLRRLARGGGSDLLTVVAQIDFFGADVAGRAITASTLLSITFADFAEDEA